MAVFCSLEDLIDSLIYPSQIESFLNFVENSSSPNLLVFEENRELFVDVTPFHLKRAKDKLKSMDLTYMNDWEMLTGLSYKDFHSK
ncbi:hypothetical protein A3715_15380 [Oleiphilus sp. HI0009]|nr:hypothetical protein A3715_15380 [Oleiphilus sp. HI0009]